MAFCDLKMSQRHDLSKSMAWRIIGRLESGQHNIMSQTLLKLTEMSLQGCGIDSKKQGMLHVDQGKVGHTPLQQLMTGTYC